ncbi:MAG: division/cell wall cluster transcriptional repressor MraZ [Myxococcales bacterium]|nr:division/cell wall cluster transcriptional repressor MraZ [Myxococcales bacterium]
MFWGSHDHVLDDKGRTSLPKDFRDALAKVKGTPWITALRNCLAIYTVDEFEALQQRLTNASGMIDSVQRIQRLVLGMASHCPADRQGRILIPPKLRAWSHLERDLVLAGVGSRIEIWDRNSHSVELERSREQYDDLTRDFKDFGL